VITLCVFFEEIGFNNYLFLNFARVVENQHSRLSIINIAKCFAPMIIGHSRSQVDDGLKKLQDVKEQQLVSLQS
jgi:hypothetical protein